MSRAIAANRDVVGLWRDDFKQFCALSRPMNCRVTEPTKNMEHPVESGSVITDHRVILPVEIEMSLVMDADSFADQYAQLRTAMKNATLLYVHTRTSVYGNMIITDMPHDENPDQYDTIAVSLRLKEVILVTATFEPLPPRSVQNKDNSSTKDRGQTQKKDPQPKAQAKVKQSLASRLISG